MAWKSQKSTHVLWLGTSLVVADSAGLVSLLGKLVPLKWNDSIEKVQNSKTEAEENYIKSQEEKDLTKVAKQVIPDLVPLHKNN